jgi:predicted nucleic acid-binding protein
LNITTYTTQYVLDEVKNEVQLNEISKYIEKAMLIVDSDGDFQTVIDISAENSALSVADSSVLELAVRKNGTILSSDGSLRKISTRNGITVRGILWIIEELCNQEIITASTAMQALTKYTEINFRPAPKHEIEKLTYRLNEKQKIKI